MASEFQRAKISGVFAAMDADGDGLLRRADFRALADRWTAVRGEVPGSPGATRLELLMLGWWDALRAVADTDGDGGVSPEEVLAVVDRLPQMRGAVTATAEAMFEAVDADGDGWISAAEYALLIEVWNGRPTDTAEVFPLLDGDGDGLLSEAEFTALWTEFWAGDDPGAPGTWVFGRFALHPA